MEHHQIETIIAQLIGKYGWFILVFFIGSMFRSMITNGIEGIGIFFGNDFNNDDLIYVNGREARIVRVTLQKTVFYMVDKNTKMVIKNSRLKYLTMEKELKQSKQK